MEAPDDGHSLIPTTGSLAFPAPSPPALASLAPRGRRLLRIPKQSGREGGFYVNERVALECWRRPVRCPVSGDVWGGGEVGGGGSLNRPLQVVNGVGSSFCVLDAWVGWSNEACSILFVLGEYFPWTRIAGMLPSSHSSPHAAARDCAGHARVRRFY